MLHRQFTYLSHNTLLKHFGIGCAAQHSSHLTQGNSTLFAIQQVAPGKVLMLCKQKGGFREYKSFINIAVLLLIFNVLPPSSLIEGLHVASQLQKSSRGMNAIFLFQSARYPNKVFQAFTHKVQWISIEIYRRELGFQGSLLEGLHMDFMFGIEFPKRRLKLAFEVRCLRILQDYLRVKAKGLILADNWHIGLRHGIHFVIFLFSIFERFFAVRQNFFQKKILLDSFWFLRRVRLSFCEAINDKKVLIFLNRQVGTSQPSKRATDEAIGRFVEFLIGLLVVKGLQKSSASLDLKSSGRPLSENSFLIIIQRITYIIKQCIPPNQFIFQLIIIVQPNLFFHDLIAQNNKINFSTQPMIENSLLSNKDVYAAFTKFQRVSSDYKFRAKSIRVKTISNDMEEHITQKLGLPVIYNNHSQVKFHTMMNSAKPLPNQDYNTSIEKARAQSYKIVEKNYEQQLNSFGVDSQFLKKIFEIKCQETQTKYNEQRYQIFVKNVALRLCKYKHLPINQMGFSALCLQTFFQWYVEWNGHITDIDLSYASQLLKVSKMKIVKNLLESDKKLMKLSLCNSNLDDDELKVIFTIINQKCQLFSLDISNINSQSLNRLGDSMNLLNQFLLGNQSVAIFKANNLHIKKEGFQHICKAITARKINPLKILMLSNNYISGANLCESFYSIVRSGLSHLDLSSNPLGQQFYKNLPVLKGSTLRQLSLQQTNMTSQNLYQFLEKIEQCKTLSVLKLDKNDFSHHWFGKIGEKLQTNSCLQWLSLNDCQIKSFLPLFQGLTQNRYLRRLDANNNIIDCQSEIPKKIVECFIFNKNLQEIRFRFCNLNAFIINKIMEGLLKNQKVKYIDISQNLLEDSGGNSILKMLQKNQRIQTIGIQKLQLSQQMRKRIYLKLKENKALRQKEQFGRLRSLTTDLKARDGYTWEDVNEMEEQDRNLSNKLKITQQKVQKLEDIVSVKRQKINQLTKKCNQEIRKVQANLKERIRLQNERVRQAQKQVTNLSKQQLKIKQLQTKQAEEIQLLQRKVKEANEKNKRRENELEDKLRNLKYLQRKKSKGVNIDYSPKKYSKHIH